MFASGMTAFLLEFLDRYKQSQVTHAKLVLILCCRNSTWLRNTSADILFLARPQGSRAIPHIGRQAKHCPVARLHIEFPGTFLGFSVFLAFRRTLASAHSCCALAPACSFKRKGHCLDSSSEPDRNTKKLEKKALS